MIPAAVLAVVVQAQGVIATNQQLQSVQNQLEQAAHAANQLDHQLDQIGGVNATVDLNVVAALADCQKVKECLGSLSDQTVHVKVIQTGGGCEQAAGCAKNFNMASAAAGIFARTIALVRPAAMIAALGFMAQALAATSAGALALAGALAPLAGALAALPALLVAGAQGAGVFKLATMGVLDALKEQLKGSTAAGGGAIKQAGQEEAASRAIRAAQEAVRTAKEGVAAASRAVAEAQRTERTAVAALGPAYDQARRALADMRTTVSDATLSLRGARFAAQDARAALAGLMSGPSPRVLADAHRALTQTLRGQVTAAQALTDAHSALQELLRPVNALDSADAHDAVTDAIRGEEQAALSLGRALDRAATVAADPTATPADVAQSRLDVRDAENAIGDAARETARARERLAKLEAGPAQSAIAAARRAVESAENGVGDAALATARARGELAKVEAPASADMLARARHAVALADQAVGAAQRDVTRSTRDLVAAEARGVSGSADVVAAREAIRQATSGTADAQRGLTNAHRDVAQAMRGVAEAQRDAVRSTAAAGAAAVDMNAKLNALPPSAQAFVRQLLTMKDKVTDLRTVAADGFFPGATEGLLSAARNFEPLKRVVAATSTVLGGLAKDAGTLVGSSAFGRDLATVGTRNAKIIDILGHAALDVADALRHVIVAAGPLVMWLARLAAGWADNLSKAAEAGRESGKMAAFFEKTRAVLDRVFSIAGNVGTAFWNIAKAGSTLGNDLLASFDKVTASFARWTKSAEGQNKIQAFFENARGPIYEVSKLIRDVVKGFAGLSQQPGLEDLIRKVRTELLPVLLRVLNSTTAAFGPALIEMLSAVARAFEPLAGSSGPLVLYVEILTSLAEAAVWIFQNVPGAAHAITLLVGALAVGKALGFAASITGLTTALGFLRGATIAAWLATVRYHATMIALRIGIIAMRAAVIAITAAQWLLNVAMTANPIGLVILAVIAIIAVFVLLGGKLGWLTDAFAAAWDWIKGATSDAWDWIKNAVSDGWQAVKRITTTVWNQVAGFLSGIWGSIKSTVGGALAAIGGFIAGAWTAISGATTAVWGAIRSFLSGAWAGIVQVVSGGASAVRTAVSGAWDAITGLTTAAWEAVKSVTSGAWGAIKSTVAGAIDGAADAVRGTVSALREYLSDAWGSIRDRARDVWDTVKDAISGAVRGAVSTVKGLVGQFVEIGGDIVRGIASGIKNAAGAVWDAVKDLVGGAVGKAKDLLKAWSPSRVFMEIGHDTGLGFALGLADEVRAVERQMRSLVAPPAPVARAGGAPVSSTGAPALDLSDLVVNVFIGGERIDERVDVRIDRRDRRDAGAWNAGVIA